MLGLGYLLETRGDLEGAEQWYFRAADAGYPDATFKLGNLLAGRGDIEAPVVPDSPPARPEVRDAEQEATRLRQRE